MIAYKCHNEGQQPSSGQNRPEKLLWGTFLTKNCLDLLKIMILDMLYCIFSARIRFSTLKNIYKEV